MLLHLITIITRENTIYLMSLYPLHPFMINESKPIQPNTVPHCNAKL